MPSPPDSSGKDESEEANGNEPSKMIAEAASKFEFTKVECLLFIFHTVGKQAPQFLTDNAEILKEFKVRLWLNYFIVKLISELAQEMKWQRYFVYIFISEPITIFCPWNSRLYKKTTRISGKQKCS